MSMYVNQSYMMLSNGELFDLCPNFKCSTLSHEASYTVTTQVIKLTTIRDSGRKTMNQN